MVQSTLYINLNNSLLSKNETEHLRLSAFGYVRHFYYP